MTTGSLILNGLPYSYQELKAGQKLIQNPSPFEKSTLEFCYQWLNGQQEFTIHTSGSTGKPKAISIRRQQMIASARMTGNALDLQMGDHALVCLNTAFIAGKMMLVRGFELGLRMTVVEPSANPFSTTASENFEFMAVVPLQLQTILDSPQKEILDRMKAVIVGGAPVSYALEQEIQALDVPIYATYGMTETVSHIALKLLNTSNKNTYFQAFPEVKLSLDDRGCLCIQSALTYNEKIVTNDLVAFHSAHEFEWIGRADFVINSGGVKLQTERIEEAIARILFQLNESARFFVSGLPDERLGQAVTLIIEQKKENFPVGRFQNELKKSLTKYEKPKQLHFVDHFEETGTGKVSRINTLKKYDLLT